MPRPKSEATWKLEVGRRFAAARAVLRDGEEITQEELAPMLGISRSTLANGETGRSLLPAAAIRRLDDRFGVPMQWIYKGSLVGMPQWLMRYLAPTGAEPDEPAPPRKRRRTS